MEKADRISIETGSKGLGYLRELLVNDGPEFSYTVVFWEKNNAKKIQDRRMHTGITDL